MIVNKKTGIAFIVCLIFVTLVSLALAFPGNSSTYSFTSSTQGVNGGVGNSSAYSLRFTQTANQAGDGNATSASYSMNMGWFNLTYAAGVVTVTLNSVQCSNDTSNYYSCTQMSYDTNITHIKVNCTASGSSVTTVSYKLYNTPDSAYYINESNYTYSSGDAYILNSSYKLQDSGEWNLTVSCYNNASNVTNNNTNWTLAWGWINVSLTSPSSDANVTKDEFFTFTSNVECLGGECGAVNVTLDPYEVDGNSTSQNESEGEDGDQGGDAQDAPQVINEINILLEYKGGSQWDEDNDGIETTDGAVDLTVEDTGFSWNVSEENLCTKWMTRSFDNATDSVVCYGSQECCNLMSLNSLEPSWDSAFYSHFGKYGATYDNLVAAQVIYADYSLEIEDVHSEIYYSDWQDLPVNYVESDGTTEDVAQVFDEGETIYVEGKKVGEKVEDEPDYETHFILIEQNSSALRLIFYHDAESPMWVRIDGDVERTMTTRYARPFQNITLIIYKVDGLLPRFELHLGEESEVFQFGKVIPEVSIEGGQYSIIDREDDKLDIEIVKGSERIELTGVENEPEITADILPVADPIIKTNVAFVENLTNLETAIISLRADETITSIFYCAQFDAGTSMCNAWQKMDTPFVQEEGFIRFTVDHFSAYAGGTTNDTAYLVIWDETDPGMPNASQSRALNASVLFFADYKLTSNGTKITDGTCQIKFGSGNYTNMTYNTTYTYYTYNRSFSTNGVYSFTIKCNHSTYSSLNATDTVSVPTTAKNGAVSTITGATPFYTNSSNPQNCSVLRAGDSCSTSWYVNATGVLDSSHVFYVIYSMTNNTAYVSDNQTSNITLTISANDTTSPSLTSVNVTPTIANTAQQITLYATATDNVQVDTCWANITLPNSTVVQKTDVCTASKTYTTVLAGVHNVTFYANDTSGNEATPSSLTFTVDTASPNLNSTSTSVTSSSVTVSFSANESVNASVNYGTSTALGSTATVTAFASSGTVSISSLSASTTYYYNITICDQAANCLTNGTYNFTTSAADDDTGGGGGGGGGGGTTLEPEPELEPEVEPLALILPPGSVDRGSRKEAEEPSEAGAAEEAKPVEASPAPVEEPVPEVAPAPITGAVTEERKAPRVTLQMGWWLLVALIFIVLSITYMIERKRKKKIDKSNKAETEKSKKTETEKSE